MKTLHIFELLETNHGVDGWDARTKSLGHFRTKEQAVQWLADRGYTRIEEYGAFFHADNAKRFCMCAISYEIKEQVISFLA
jgi:hypothetical protein